MKLEIRRYTIRKSDFSDFEKTPSYYNLPLLIENSKGQKQVLSAGMSDTVSVFRYGKDMAVLYTNSSLGYAGLQIVDFDRPFTEHPDDDMSVFIQNTEELREYLSKDFFDYTKNVQADIMIQYLP